MRIAVLGAAGRMGRLIAAEIWQRQRSGASLELCGLAVHADDPLAGQPAASGVGLTDCPLALTADPAAVIQQADVAIDFTSPSASRAHLALAVANGTALLIGTTGLTEADEVAIDQAGATIPVLLAANTSLGVNLLLDTVRRVAASLPDEGFDIEIVEMHHNRKVDAPSGTALALGQAAAEGRDVSLRQVQRLSREGHTGTRPVGEIGFATLRGGDVVGEHTVIFAGAGERIEVTHRCTDRAIFARGAVVGGAWLAGRPAGRYRMADVLGLDKD